MTKDEAWWYRVYQRVSPDKRDEVLKAINALMAERVSRNQS